jgi:RNA recognition motif-containing protein
MVERLPLAILAPFMKQFNETQTEATVELPDGIRERLTKPGFTAELFPASRPPTSTLRLIRTMHGDVAAALNDEELVEREFSGARWQQQVQRSLREGGLLQDRSGWIDDSQQLVPLDGVPDGLFCVKVDNLPDGVWREQLARFLIDNNCNYFSKIVVPLDRRVLDDEGIEKSRRFAFVKFERLRWALKFVEDFQKLRMENFILGVCLGV